MSASLAAISGWAATAVFVSAACVPLLHRLRARRRMGPDSPSTTAHLVVGIAAAVIAFAHTICILPSLGSPGAVGGGMLAMGPGVVAFFLLFAHVGVGSRLRDKRLKERPRVRRTHLILASCIAVGIVAHVAVLLAGA